MAMNGWRKLSAHAVRYTKHDNVLLWIEDLHRAQTFADRFASLNWPAILSAYAKRVNPVMKALLPHSQYYWVTTQSEYSTDILFKRREDFCELYRELISHSTRCFGAQEIMGFLGHKCRWRPRRRSCSRASWPVSIVLRGFSNRDIRTQLAATAHLRACVPDPRKQSAKISRTFRRFHAHGLIAKIPHTRR